MEDGTGSGAGAAAATATAIAAGATAGAAPATAAASVPAPEPLEEDDAFDDFAEERESRGRACAAGCGNRVLGREMPRERRARSNNSQLSRRSRPSPWW